MGGKNALLLQRFGQHSAADIALWGVVVGELRFGAERSADPSKQHAQVDVFVQQFVSLESDDVTAHKFGQIGHFLESKGMAIGPFDTQIAAAALVHNLILVTHNTAEFSRVPGLTLEDWEKT